MKKILLMSLCMVTSLVCVGQKIVSDYENNGYRVVSTETFGHVKISSTDTNLAFGLATFAGEDTTTVLQVLVTSFYSLRIPANARMLIKCADGKMLELQSALGEDKDRIGNYSTVTKMTKYMVSTSFRLENSDISSLCSGVYKVRLEVFHGTESYYEKTYNDKQAMRIGAKLIECANNIRDTLESDGGFYEGF